MDRTELFQKAKEIILGQFTELEEQQIVEEASFIEDFGADSLDLVELVIALQDGFGIHIPDEDFENIRTVGEALDYISERI